MKWASPELMKLAPSTMRQVIREHPVSMSSPPLSKSTTHSTGRMSCSPLKLRGVVASRRIHRGERLAVIPADHVLTGQQAYQMLHDAFQPLGGTRGGEGSVIGLERVSPWNYFLAHLQRVTATCLPPPPPVSSRSGQAWSMQEGLWTRNAMLITAAIYLLHTACAPSQHHHHNNTSANNSRRMASPPSSSHADTDKDQGEGHLTHRVRDRGTQGEASWYSALPLALPSCTAQRLWLPWVQSWPKRIPSLGDVFFSASSDAETFQSPVERRVKKPFLLSSAGPTSPASREEVAFQTTRGDHDTPPPSRLLARSTTTTATATTTGRDAVDAVDCASEANANALEGTEMTEEEELVLQRALTHGIHAAEDALTVSGGKVVDLVPSTRMRWRFFESSSVALSPRQHAHQARQPESIATQAGWRRLRHLDAEAERVLHELSQAFLQACSARDSERKDVQDASAAAALLERIQDGLRWSHFMMRSRAVYLPPVDDSVSAPSELAVVPLLDMLNHSFDQYNVTYTCSENGGPIIISAARHIAAGEELTLHYGNRRQRCGAPPATSSPPPAQFDPRKMPLTEITRDIRSREEFDSVTPMTGVRPPHTSSSYSSEGGAQLELDRLHAETESGNDPMKELWEAREREAAVEADELERLSRLFHKAGSVSCSPEDAWEKARRSLQEVQAEADWIWRFGFARGEAEKLQEASSRWSSSLRERIAKLTDARRHGRPGEFVIGVPEGLEHLREQRQRLERERYSNHRVFPPQRE